MTSASVRGEAPTEGTNARDTKPRLGVRRLTLVAIAAFACMAGLVTAHGMWPGLVGDMSNWYVTVGAVGCGAISLRAVAAATCPVVGLPDGAPVGNGQPFTVLGSLLARGFGLAPEFAVGVASALLLLIGLLGCVALLRRSDIGWSVAFVASMAYLLIPTTVGMANFGSTFWGVVLLPGAICACASLTETAISGSWWRRIGAVGAWTALSTTLLLLDGYGFMMAVAGSAVLLAVEAARRRCWASAVSSAAAFVIANATAVGLYRVLSPVSDAQRSSIDLFRAMGADVVTFLAPTGAVWWAGPLGVARSWSKLWGDGTNSHFNYLGFVMLGLAVRGAVWAWRRRSAALAWAAIGLLALIMSLGPSLKVNEVRGPLAPPVTYESYLMSADAAALTLPTEAAYESLPGFDMMRATYRWMALVRLALVILAAFAVERMIRRRGRAVAVGTVLGLVAIIELMPNIPATVQASLSHGRQITAFNDGVVVPLDAATTDGTTAVLTPNASGGNDFLAAYIATNAHLSTYNVGVDKALERVRASWPEPVGSLLAGTGEVRAKDVAIVLSTGLADYVVVPYFDLRWSAAAWPTGEQWAQPGRRAANALGSIPTLTVTDHGSFALVTLAKARAGQP